MPTIEGLTTKSTEIAWQSPDKTRTIHKVVMDYQGKPFEARTYSDAIATVGWSGTVETYEVPGKGDFPAQTFVKQPQKEGGFQPRGGGFSKGGGRPMADPFTMYLSYAKDLMVARIAAGIAGEEGGDFNSTLEATIAAAYTLYESRPDATDKPVKADVVAPVAENQDIGALLQQADEGNPPIKESELPWGPTET